MCSRNGQVLQDSEEAKADWYTLKDILAAKRAVVLEPHEKQVVTLLQQLTTLQRDKAHKRRAKLQERHKAYLADKGKQDDKRLKKTRELKREFYRGLGKLKKKKDFGSSRRALKED